MNGQNKQHELTDNENNRIKELAKKAEATYRVIEEVLPQNSGVKGDAERFIPIIYLATEDLLKHSEKLGILTKALIVLTVILVVLTGVLIWRTF